MATRLSQRQESAPHNESSDKPSPGLSRHTFDIVALAASAGGLRAVSSVLESLPSTFPGAIVIVQHLAPQHLSFMADILARKTTLGVKQAQEGDRLERGMVYVAPPNYHLVVNLDKTLSLTQTERVHFLRPAADLLFDSVAAAYQSRAVAVVLSGTGSDGAEGVRAIHEMGGIVIAQDEETSEFFGMPNAAIETGTVDLILPLHQISAALMNLRF